MLEVCLENAISNQISKYVARKEMDKCLKFRDFAHNPYPYPVM